MKGIAMIALVAAIISLLLGVVARFMNAPIAIAPGGVAPATFLDVANTLLLAAIALALLKK